MADIECLIIDPHTQSHRRQVLADTEATDVYLREHVLPQLVAARLIGLRLHVLIQVNSDAITACIDALRFYADLNAYYDQHGHTDLATGDGGQRAQAALMALLGAQEAR